MEYHLDPERPAANLARRDLSALEGQKRPAGKADELTGGRTVYDHEQLVFTAALAGRGGIRGVGLRRQRAQLALHLSDSGGDRFEGRVALAANVVIAT
jgi:hypothetical protein